MTLLPFKYFRLALNIVLMIVFSPVIWAALPEIPVDPEAAQIWKSRRTQTIQELDGKPDAERIPALGQMVRQLRVLRYRECPEREEIISTIQDRLLAIPGHAKYYGDRIKAAQAARKAVVNNVQEFGPEWVKFIDTVESGFPTLAQLPSPETVKVLGDFLSDEWVCPYPMAEMGEEPPLAAYSLRVLTQLKLANPPVKLNPDHSYHPYPADLRTWQLWYEQVKSGKRTFRFEGDPHEYDLDGPVIAAASLGKPGVKPPGNLDAGKPSTSRYSTVGIAAALFAIAAAVIYSRRMRARRG